MCRNKEDMEGPSRWRRAFEGNFPRGSGRKGNEIVTLEATTTAERGSSFPIGPVDKQ